MKRKLLLFSLLVALFVPWAAMAQNELTIYENGTASSATVPVHGLWADAYLKCEFVVPASELEDMTGGTISQMTFYLTSTAAEAWTGTFQVFLKEVDNSTISAFYGTTDAVIVYEGLLDGTQSTMEVPFNDNYTYGGSNLLVGFYQITKGIYKSASFAGASVTGASVQGYSSSSLDAISASQKDFVPKTTFTYTPGGGPTCEKPDAVTVENITSTSATITWTGGSGNYNVEYKLASETTWTRAYSNHNTTSCQLSALQPGKVYQVRVQSTCGTNPDTGEPVTSGWKSPESNFNTLCGVITSFPWTEPFENYNSGEFNDPCWINERIQDGEGYGTLSVFKVNTSTIGGNTTHQLQLPDMPGGTLTMLRLPEMNLPGDNYEFALQVYRSSSTYNDNYALEGIRVYASTDGYIDDATELAFIPRQYNTGNSVIPAEEAIGWYEYELPIGFSGTCYIILRGESQYCTSTYMDDLSVKQIPTCPKPKNLSLVANSVTGHTATLRWLPALAGQTEWQFSLTQNGEEQITDPVTSADSTYMLTGLTGDTQYTVKVRAYCNANDQSEWSNTSVIFTTLVTCEAPTAFQYTDLTNHDVKLSWTSDADAWVVAYKAAADADFTEIDVTENPYTLTGLSPETSYTVKVRANCGTVDGLSRWTSTQSFTTPEAYPAPVNLVCTGTTAYEATLKWTELGLPSIWELDYKLADAAEYDTINNRELVDAIPFELGNLTPNSTNYVFRVRSVYAAEGIYSEWSAEGSFTTLETCDTPTALTVIDNTARSANLRWNSVYNTSWTVKYRPAAHTQVALAQDFENGLGDWNFTSMNTTNGIGGSGTYPAGIYQVAGHNGFRFSSYTNASDYNQYLVSPELDGVGELTFYAWRYGTGDNLYLGISTTTDDLDAFTWNALSFASTSTWQEFSQEITSDVKYIAFHYYGSYAYYAYVDDIIISEPINAGEWATTPAEDNPFELTGLTPETYYEVVVIGNCGEGVESGESEPAFFTTLISCPKPTELAVVTDSITTFSAKLEWEENGQATEWVIEYTAIVDGEAIVDSITATENPYWLEGLLSGTPYTAKVKAHCGENDESEWSNTVRFVTIATCPDPTDFAVTKVTGHTATMVWNGTNQSYMVNYRIPSHMNGIDEGFGTSLPTGWEMYTGLLSNGTATLSTNNYAWSFGTDHGVFDDHARINIYSNYQKWLVAPAFTVDADYATLTFDLALTAWSSGVMEPVTTGTDDKFMVLISTDDMATWTTLREWNNEEDAEYVYNDISSDVDGEAVSIDLSAYAGQNVRIAFYGESTVSNADNNLHIDNVYIGYVIPATEWIPAPTNDTTVTIDNLDPKTTYEARLQGICDGEESHWTDTIAFTTTVACPAPTQLAVNNDSITGHSAYFTWTENGLATNWQICVNNNMNDLIEVADNPFYTLEGLEQDHDYTVKVRANCGGDDGTSTWSNSVSFHTSVTCPKPTNLQVTGVTNKTADVTWDGESEYFVVQYNPWHQVGSDRISTEVLKPYTFDLSEYSGRGSIAIRHYDVTDVFYLNVDDIEVTNAQGEVVFSENFESGNIPSTMTNLDYDGDGYVWTIRSQGQDDYGNPTVNGNYGVTSASWYSQYVGALNPDNWLIINDVELGGSLTFMARGQDPDFPAENFGVFVLADNEFENHEEEADENNFEFTRLKAGTIYEWRVKGFCDEDGSQWATSSFATLENLKTFVKNGNWNDGNNWEPVGVPTFDDKVQIDSAAYIPAGVVAQAKKATLGEGSITIADGGQLKQGSASLHVTMEKVITGYGEGNDKWYLISAPFNGRTVIGHQDDWSSVDSLALGVYDFYALDPMMPYYEDWLNYKITDNQSHELFNGGMLYGEGYLYARQKTAKLSYEGTTWSSYNAQMAKGYLYYPDTLGLLGNGWRLVGNPYTCNAYLSFVNDEDEQLEANFYVMNANGNGLELAETGDALPPLTGAFVQYNTTGYVKYDSEEPNPAKYVRTGKFVMNLSQGDNAIDKAVVRFGKGMSLEKMSFNNNSSKLYITVDGNDYAVVYKEKAATVPVSFKAETAGSYTINYTTDSVTFGELILIDNANGTKVDLLANPSYTFETEAGDFDGRFTITYVVK